MITLNLVPIFYILLRNMLIFQHDLCRAKITKRTSHLNEGFVMKR